MKSFNFRNLIPRAMPWAVSFWPFRPFLTCDSRIKSFALLTFFRHFGFAELLGKPSETSFESYALGNEKKNQFSFCISLVFS